MGSKVNIHVILLKYRTQAAAFNYFQPQILVDYALCAVDFYTSK